MNIYEKLMNIQSELKAPKSQYNSFGKYNYRNLEDILESLKPLLAKYKALINISDEIVLIGERYYVKATAKLVDIEKEAFIPAVAYAREDENKKGMDLSQLTGSTSSYARKYALNGLFAIDDTKDSDSINTHTHSKEESKGNKNKPKGNLTENQIKRLYAIAYAAGHDSEKVKEDVKKQLGKEIKDLSKEEYDTICSAYEKLKK